MSNPKLLDYFETKIKALLNKKVDKVPGKGLSTEDYTTAEKTKLAGIPPGGGGGVTVDSAMSSTSTNPVQNKVIYTALGNKVDKVTGKGLSTEDFTTAEKTKLAELDPDPIMIDDELDGTSENPVQNKVIYDALQNVMPIIDDALDSSSTNAVQNSVLYTAFNAVNNKTNLSGVISPLSARINVNSMCVYMEGSMIWFSAYVTAKTTLSNSPQILTVSQGYRPPIDVTLTMLDLTSGIASSLGESVQAALSSTGSLFSKKIETDHIYLISGQWGLA